MKLIPTTIRLFFVSIFLFHYWPKNESSAQPAIYQTNFTQPVQERAKQAIQVIDSTKQHNDRELTDHKQRDDQRDAALLKSNSRVSELEALIKALQKRNDKAQAVLTQIKNDYLIAQRQDTEEIIEPVYQKDTVYIERFITKTIRPLRKDKIDTTLAVLKVD